MCKLFCLIPPLWFHALCIIDVNKCCFLYVCVHYSGYLSLTQRLAVNSQIVDVGLCVGRLAVMNRVIANVAHRTRHDRIAGHAGQREARHGVNVGDRVARVVLVHDGQVRPLAERERIGRLRIAKADTVVQEAKLRIVERVRGQVDGHLVGVLCTRAAVE